MGKRYELTTLEANIEGFVLYRIKALVDMPDYKVKAGDLGGWISGEHNLLQDGSGWIDSKSMVMGEAVVEHGWLKNTTIFPGKTRISCHMMSSCTVKGDTSIHYASTNFTHSFIKNSSITGIGKMEYSQIMGSIIDCNFFIQKSQLDDVIVREGELEIQDSTLTSSRFVGDSLIKVSKVNLMEVLNKTKLVGVTFNSERYGIYDEVDWVSVDLHVKSSKFIKPLTMKQVTLKTSVFNGYETTEIYGFKGEIPEGFYIGSVKTADEDYETSLNGYRDSTIQVEAQNLIVSNLQILGSPILKGSIHIQNSTITGRPLIELDGRIQNSTIQDLAVLQVDLSKTVFLKNIVLSEDQVYVDEKD